MKKTLPIMAALFTGAVAHAQWTTDVSANTTVRALTPGEASSPMVADGPDGSTYVSWFENGSGSYQLRMQRLDASGFRLWPDTGLVVSTHPQNSAIFRYDLRSDNNGNAIVAFQDERSGALDVVAYAVAPDGSFLWGPDGVELHTPGSTGLSPRVAPLDNGTVAIAWNTNHSPGRIAFQLVGPGGAVLLPQAGMLSAATRLSRPVPVPAENGSFLLQYELEGANFLAPATMLAQRINAEGATEWAEPVQVSTKTISGFYFPQPASDGHGGLYVAFNTGNPTNPNYTDVYVQRVRASGSLWSAEGTRMDEGNMNQKFTAGKGFGIVSDLGGLLVPLQVTDGSQNQSGVAVQEVDTAGGLPLGATATMLIPLSANYTAPQDISATGDGAVIVHASGGFGQQHLGATRVDLSLSPLWNPAQRDLSTANSNKDDLATTSLRGAQVVAVWQDDRTPNGIYAQHITQLDVEDAVAGTDPAAGFRLEQNPAESPVLINGNALAGPVDIQVFDAQGRRVLAQRASAQQRLAVPAEGMAPGLYTIRILGGGHTAAVRWIHP